MKYFKFIILALLTVVVACEDDDRFVDTAQVQAPTNLGLEVDITQDNSGLVTLTPSGEGVVSFELFFNSENSESVILELGESVENVYPEGTYEIKVIATGITGLTTEFLQPLTVSFQAPQNLNVTIVPVTGSNFDINVSATADFETNFEFFPGEFTDEQGISFLEGETITYSYSSVGTFTARVVAYSGGAETAEVTQEVTIENPLLLPIDFEDTMQDYGFIDFEGTQTSVVSNPDASGVNTSALVAQTIKTEGAQFFAGTVITLDEPIDFSMLNNIRINTYSPTSGIVVKMKLENATDNTISTEVDVVNTVANQWETLTYDFSGSDLTQEYSKIIVFFDFENAGDGSTYFWDDINLTAPANTPLVNLPVTFEDPNLNYMITGFAGADSAVETNSVSGGVNTSTTVVRTTKTNGAEFFAGTTVQLDVPINFGGNERVAVKTYSPKANIPVRLKLESPDGNTFVELDVNTTVVNEWEVLVWDFSGMTVDDLYTKATVFFEFVPDLQGDGTTYYFDDIELFEGTPVTLPVTFEDPNANYMIIGFEGADSAIEANTVAGGINTSATAVRTTKTNGAQFFAGTVVQLSQTIDFSGNERVSVKTYSPKANIPVRLKLESPDGNSFVELDVNTTVENQWEELVWDFSGMTTNNLYTKAIIFFEFVPDLPGDGTTYYFDDIQLAN